MNPAAPVATNTAITGAAPDGAPAILPDAAPDGAPAAPVAVNTAIFLFFRQNNENITKTNT
jgi:hypothetical protein